MPWESALSCEDEKDAIVACVFPAGPCDYGECYAGGPDEPTLRCEYSCGGVLYTSSCDLYPARSEAAECVCQVDGETVGSCQAVGPEFMGHRGCCWAHFAETGEAP